MDGDIHEIIQSYLDQSMSTADRKIFEERLKTDPDFNKEYLLLRDIENELGDTGILDFKDKLDAIVQPSGQEEATGKVKEEKKAISRRMIWWSLAATLLLLIGVFWIMNDQSINSNSKYDLLAEQYFVAYPLQDRTRGDEVEDNLYQNYRSKKYALAAKELKGYADKNNDDEARLFAGISFIAIDEIDNALALLDKINSNVALDNKVNYYKGVSYLKQTNKDKALIHFNKVNGGDEFLYKKAQEIISKI